MTGNRTIVVGTRTSPLALAQTDEVLSRLRSRHPEVELEVVPLSTGGDRRKNAPLLSLGKGTFVKDIESALIEGRIDIAVHSAKDLTATLPAGVALAATAPREDPRDVQVNRWGLPLAKLPSRARLGTSSPRRTAQLKAFRPDLDIVPIRGNVGTRLARVSEGDFDGVVLAAAGLHRLSRKSEITEYLDPDTFTPEVGQGTLAVQAGSDDEPLLEMLGQIDDRATSVALEAEREFLSVLGGGCKVPVAAFARLEDGVLRIDTMAAVPDGSRLFRASVTASPDDPRAAGRGVAEALLQAGAGEIIATP